MEWDRQINRDGDTLADYLCDILAELRDELKELNKRLAEFQGSRQEATEQ